MALNEMKSFLKENKNGIAVFDGTNTTIERRDLLR